MIPEIEMRDIPNTATPDVGTCPALHSRPIAGVRHLDVFDVDVLYYVIDSGILREGANGDTTRIRKGGSAFLPIEEDKRTK